MQLFTRYFFVTKVLKIFELKLRLNVYIGGQHNNKTKGNKQRNNVKGIKNNVTKNVESKIL